MGESVATPGRLRCDGHHKRALCARAKPLPTGSATSVNTIGTVRVAWSNGAMVEPPEARITSGASATNSAANLRRLSALPAPRRMSIPDVTSVGPAQLLQRLLERLDVGLRA